MNIIVDLHERAFEETDKISSSLGIDAKILRLFNGAKSSEFDELYNCNVIVLSGSDKPDLLESREIELIKPRILKAAKNGANILGICAGNQVLGKFFQYDVVRVSREVGWPEIYLTKNGKSNPLFRGLPDTIRPFSLHNKVVKGIEEYKVLAKNNYSQAVLYYSTNRSVVYGIQFHPEESVESGKKFLKENKKYRTIGEKVSPVSSFSRPETYVEWKVLCNFVDLVKNLSRIS